VNPLEVADGLRPILAQSPGVLPEGFGRPAGVLVPIIAGPEPTSLVFTERHADLSRHAGEISFPGGLQDPGETLVQTALRECREEIDLDPHDVEVVGSVDGGHRHRPHPALGSENGNACHGRSVAAARRE